MKGRGWMVLGGLGVLVLVLVLLRGGTTQRQSPNHASTSATQLYDRRRDELTLDGRADRNSISVSSRSGSSERRTPGPVGI